MLEQPFTLVDIRGACGSFPTGSRDELLVLEKVELTFRTGEIVGGSSCGKSRLPCALPHACELKINTRFRKTDSPYPITLRHTSQLVSSAS